MMGGKTVDDPVGADLLRIVDEQRNPRTDTGFDHHVGYPIPVPGEHHPQLSQHRRDRRQRNDTGDLLHVITQQSPERESEFVRGHPRIGTNPPIPQQFCVRTAAGEQAQNDVGIPDIDSQEHHYTIDASRVDSIRGVIRPDPSGACAGSLPSSTWRFSASTNTTRGA